MTANIDLDAFYENIRATKPPYECPVVTCRKIYRSFTGMEQHVKRHEKLELDGNQSVIMSSCEDEDGATSTGVNATGSSGGENAAMRLKRACNGCGGDRKDPLRQQLTYASPKDIVEAEINGRLHAVNCRKVIQIISVTSTPYINKNNNSEANKNMSTNGDNNEPVKAIESPTKNANKTPGKKPRGNGKPRKVKTVLLSQYSKPAVPSLKDASVNLVDDPIKKTTPSQIWNLFNESQHATTTAPTCGVGGGSDEETTHQDHNATLGMDDTVAYVHDQVDGPTTTTAAPTGTTASTSSTPATSRALVGVANDRKHKLYNFMEKTSKEKDIEIEYDMDDEDYAWLDLVNNQRVTSKYSRISPENFEYSMDRFEKEAFFQSTKKEVPESSPGEPEEDTECNICQDSECHNSNVILFCDMCNLAVHQECYGVPYVPEGQWLCRRCLHSPSRPVECCLCPNGSIGAAFKRTEDARWAHVICALWIPEVGFANTVFLEPIDSLLNIPQARWRLTCYICKERGVGACIQCHKTNCYTAFHVTCAQLAGLYMRIESSANGTASSLRKSAFCDVHTPENHDPCRRKTYKLDGNSSISDLDNKGSSQPAIDNGAVKKMQDGVEPEEPKMGAVSMSQMKANSKKQMRKARKILAKKRNSLPAVSIPIISDIKIEKIGTKIDIENKAEFLSKLHKFWSLKRRSRNGVPLIRRLQSNQMSRHNKEIEGNCSETVAQNELTDRNNGRARMVYLKHLRNRLECLRLLVECIRKREKTKRDLLAVQEQFLKLYLQPFNVLLRRMMDELAEKDQMNIFCEPVNLDEVEDYAAIIKQPMDFQTMRSNIALNRYRGFEQVEVDFNLVVGNCLRYNAKDTVYYKAGVKLRDQGGQILRLYKRKIESIGIDKATGRHSESVPMILDGTSQPKITSLEEIITEELKETMSAKEQLDKLLVYNDTLNNKPTRKTNLSKAIGKEVARLRREITLDARNVFITSPTSKRMTQNSNQSPCQSLPMHTRRVPHNTNQTSTPVSPPSSPSIPSSCGHSSQPPSPASSAASSGKVNADHLRDEEATDDNGKEMVDQDATILDHCRGSNQGDGDGDDESFTSAPSPANDRNLQTPEPDAEDTLPLSTPDKEVISSSDFVSSPTIIKKSNNSIKSRTNIALLNNEDSVSHHKNYKNHIPKNKLGFSSPPIKRRKCQTSKRELSLEHKKHGSSASASCRSPLNPPPPPPSSFLQYRGGSGHAVLSSELDTATSDGESARTSSSTSCSPSSEDELQQQRQQQQQVVTSNGRKTVPSTSGHSAENSFNTVRQKTTSSCWSSGDDDDDDDDDVIPLNPLDLVWAKCKGYPWYPALIISPNMQSGFFHNGVPIPSPPQDVLALRSRHTPGHSLVLFFDNKRTWQWLPRSKLEPLGVDSGLDKAKQDVNKRANIRRNVQRAYYDAIQHRCRVTGEQNCMVQEYC